MMSGNMLNPWAFEIDVVRCTYVLLKELNIQNSTNVIDELRAVAAYDLIPPTFSDDILIHFFGTLQFCFMPTIDEEFATQSPHILSHQQAVSNIPLLTGYTSLELEHQMSFETYNFKYPNLNVSIANLIGNFMTQKTMRKYVSNKVFRAQ